MERCAQQVDTALLAGWNGVYFVHNRYLPGLDHLLAEVYREKPSSVGVCNRYTEKIWRNGLQKSVQVEITNQL